MSVVTSSILIGTGLALVRLSIFVFELPKKLKPYSSRINGSGEGACFGSLPAVFFANESSTAGIIGVRGHGPLVSGKVQCNRP